MKLRFDVVRQPRSLVVLTFVVMLGVMLARVILAPYPVEASTHPDMPLGALLDSLTGWSFALTNIVGGILIFVNAILLTTLIDKYYVSHVPTYLPLILYLMTAYGIFIPFRSISATIASLLLIVSAGEMIAGFQRNYTFGRVFNSALCLGTLPLIYSPAIVLAAILPATLILYRRTPREAVVAVIGYFVPFLLCTVGWWAAGQGWGFMWESLVAALGTASGELVIPTLSQIGIPAFIYFALYLLMLVYSSVLAVLYFPKMRTRARKIYIHFLFLLLATVVMFFLPSGSIISLCLLAVPGALVSTVFFIRHRGMISFVTYISLLAVVFLVNLLPLFALL